jgi:hypothetical protein
MSTIKIRRGAKANLPALNTGELGFTTDTEELYIGNGHTVKIGERNFSLDNPLQSISSYLMNGFTLVNSNGDLIKNNHYCSLTFNITGKLANQWTQFMMLPSAYRPPKHFYGKVTVCDQYNGYLFDAYMQISSTGECFISPANANVSATNTVYVLGSIMYPIYS